MQSIDHNQEFGDIVVYPLVALFFGTGNQTPFISSAILERVFMDESMRLVSCLARHQDPRIDVMPVRVFPGNIPCFNSKDESLPPIIHSLREVEIGRGGG